jgi:hypothetical protein
MHTVAVQTAGHMRQLRNHDQPCSWGCLGGPAQSTLLATVPRKSANFDL